MNEQQIKALIQEELAKSNQHTKFGLQPIPRHTHNNVDSPYTFQPILTYGGVINTNGTAALLPRGWTVIGGGVDGTGGSTGVYTITHNIGSMAYSVVTTPLDELDVGTIPQILIAKNAFIVTMFAPLGGANNTNFTFILVNPNNKSAFVPQYTGTLITQNTYS